MKTFPMETTSMRMTMRPCTTRRRFRLSVVILLISLAIPSEAMVLKTPANPTKMASPPSPVASTTTSDIISSNPLVSTLTDEQYQQDYYIPPNQLSQPVFQLGSSSSSSSSSYNKKSKSLNLFGFWCAFMCLLTGVPWTAAMSAVDALISDEQDPTKQLFDRTGKIWARAWLTLTNSMPELIGREHLQMTDNTNIDNNDNNNNAPSTTSTQPCLLVANHASWMDIPVLCAALEDHPPVFKFIAKRELTKVPGVGQQLVGGNHILIDRQDRRSQLQTFKESLQWLTKRHTSLVAFPEGQRSPDGRFQECKAGMVKLAMAAKVPIIPLSISHTHAVFPGYAWLPVQSGAGKLRVEIHEPIVFTETIVNEVDGSTSVTLTMTEDEIATAMERALRSGLPACQQPLEKEPEDSGDGDDDNDDASKGSALPADAAP